MLRCRDFYTGQVKGKGPPWVRDIRSHWSDNSKAIGQLTLSKLIRVGQTRRSDWDSLCFDHLVTQAIHNRDYVTKPVWISMIPAYKY